MKEHVETLVRQATEAAQAENALAAMQIAQAALNCANAMRALADIENPR